MKPSTKAFLSENWKFFVIYVMLGIVMYWTALVVQPTIDILEHQNQILDYQNEILETEINQSQGGKKVLTWVLGNLSQIDITSNITHIERQLDQTLNNLTAIQNQEGFIRNGLPYFNTAKPQ